MKAAHAGSLPEQQEDASSASGCIQTRPTGGAPCRAALRRCTEGIFCCSFGFGVFSRQRFWPEPSCSASADCRSLQFEGDFGAIGGVQFLHDVADMNFDRAFAQVHFIGDDLVGLSPAQCLGHFDLARRERFVGVG